jgi:hypothetical protein
MAIIGEAFKNGTRIEALSRKKYDALTTTYVHIRGTYTCNSNKKKQQFPH